MRLTVASASLDGQAADVQLPERAGHAGRPGTRLIDALWAGAVLIAAAGAVLTVLAWSDFKANDAISDMGSSVSAVAYASLGALIVRRVRNPIGWLLLVTGVCVGMLSLFSGYAVVGIVTHPGVLPAAEQVGAVAEWAFFPVVALLAFMLLLFPTGTLPSRRWRPVAVLNLLATGLLLMGFILVRLACGPPGTRRLHAHVPEPVQHPGRRPGPVRDSH